MNEQLLTAGTRLLVTSTTLRADTTPLIEITVIEATNKACLIKVGKVSEYWKRKSELINDYELFEIIHRPSQY